MKPGRLRLACAAMALPALLGGCVAAVIPVIAGAAMAGKGGKKGPKDQPAPPPPTQQAPTRPAPAPLAAGPGLAQPESSYRVLDLKELPSPSGSAQASGNAYIAFTAHALEKGAPIPPEASRDSVILDDRSRFPDVRMRPCGNLAPAVIVDLDPGKGMFDPAAPGQPQPGLAQSLTRLRSAGVTVLWASSLPVASAQAVYDRLRISGLDPDGIDRLLLLRKDEERKQSRRSAATRDWCIIAIVGDRRGDFEELFDYLKDETYAAPLEFLSGAGWFIAPPPIQPITTELPTP